jgi:hypothetical protein
MIEAFVYLWYDALNKMYYLGKHKGSPDDTYTHSSTIWESFTKDNIPEGVTRRILAKGTHEEICILEHELLVNRKKRCWNRYYNNSLGDPRYVDMSGENNPMYGKKHSPETLKKLSDRIGDKNPNWKGGIQVNDPVAYMREYDKKREQTPERKAYKKEYMREYYARNKAETQGVGTLKAFLK